MKKDIIGICPICGETLVATKLSCQNCETEISGEFQLSKFDYLSKVQQQFVLVFIKNAGNIKLIEKELDISYPTVKKYLEDIQDTLGYKKTKIDENQCLAEKNMDKKEILKQLHDGQIDFDEAERLLKQIKG